MEWLSKLFAQTGKGIMCIVKHIIWHILIKLHHYMSSFAVWPGGIANLATVSISISMSAMHKCCWKIS